MSFPKGFVWGGAAASYQIEGGAYEVGQRPFCMGYDVPHCPVEFGLAIRERLPVIITTDIEEDARLMGENWAEGLSSIHFLAACIVRMALAKSIKYGFRLSMIDLVDALLENESSSPGSLYFIGIIPIRYIAEAVG